MCIRDRYYDQELHTVLIKEDNKWKHYDSIIKHRRVWTILRTTIAIDDTPPQLLTSLTPMDIHKLTSNHIVLNVPDIPSPSDQPNTYISTWTQYLTTLPSWEQRIINDVSTDLRDIWEPLQHGNTQWTIISDGSYANNNGAYSWVIYNNGKQITQSIGMVPGNPVTAFRAELFGITTWYICISHVLEYFDLTSHIRITPYTDNAKVLQYHNMMTTPETRKPPFFHDYDLVSHMKYHHDRLDTKGIQVLLIQKIDKSHTTPPSSASIPTLLHQQVNRAANQHRMNHVSPPSNIIPINSAYLRSPEGVITNDEQSILERRSSTYTIERYYARRWQCTIAELQQFDWQTYHNTYKNVRPTLQVYIIKMMTGWLPVNHHLNKMTSSDLHCHLCKNDETIAHLYQCTHRKNWRQTFQNQLNTYLHTIMSKPEVRHTITKHFENILNKPDIYHHFSNFTVFAGLLPQKWREQYNEITNDTISNTNKWMKKLAKWILQQGYEVWTTRNTSVHNKDKTTSPMDYDLNQKIRELYSLQSEVGYHDRDIFSIPIEERLKLTQHQKMTWITNTTKTMKVSMQEYQTKQTTGQRDIRQYFTKRTQSL